MSSFFRFNQPTGRTVADAASRLNTSEFEVFQLAYENWYGRTAPEQEIKRHFDAYLVNMEVPMWVRAFAREVHGLHREGRLDPQRFGLGARPPTNTWLVCLGGVTFAAMILFVALLIYLAQRSADSTTAGCFFPPCY